jgi:hypothetical protein
MSSHQNEGKNNTKLANKLFQNVATTKIWKRKQRAKIT